MLRLSCCAASVFLGAMCCVSRAYSCGIISVVLELLYLGWKWCFFRSLPCGPDKPGHEDAIDIDIGFWLLVSIFHLFLWFWFSLAILSILHASVGRAGSDGSHRLFAMRRVTHPSCSLACMDGRIGMQNNRPLWSGERMQRSCRVVVSVSPLMLTHHLTDRSWTNGFIIWC